MIKSWLFYLSKNILNRLPILLVGLILFLLSRMSDRAFRFVIGELNYDMLSHVKYGLFKKYKIKPIQDFDNSIHTILEEGRYENIKTPNIYDLSENNFVRLNRRRIVVYKFNNVKITPDSDIITFNDHVFWEKMLRPESAMTIPLDINCASVNLYKTEVLILNKIKKTVRYKQGYSLLGVHTKAWAHFVITFIPKLLASANINNNGIMNLFIPSNMHENHIDLIDFTIKNCLHSYEYNLIFVDDGDVIMCDELYYCNTTAYFCDHSRYIHPSSACISEYSAKKVREVSESLWQVVKYQQPVKIYIGRGKGRNLYNSDEVEKFFISKGFEIVFPHLLSFEEKIQKFGNASHICGPVSSGFANLIFCKSNTKILGFFNYARSFDPFISALCYAGGYPHEIMFMTGDEEVNNNLNNSYYISLARIIACCNEIGFLND